MNGDLGHGWVGLCAIEEDGKHSRFSVSLI